MLVPRRLGASLVAAVFVCCRPVPAGSWLCLRLFAFVVCVVCPGEKDSRGREHLFLTSLACVGALLVPVNVSTHRIRDTALLSRAL
jgi:hypothetical protein